jgi:nitroreductase
MNKTPTEPPESRFVPYEAYVPDAAPEAAARRFYEILAGRRSVRAFSDRPVSRATIEHLIRVAGTAPSGANKQPWRFVAVQDAAVKKEIREAAEAEEREFYGRRASASWLRDLRAVGTDEHKPFLETAPWLIVIFKLMKDVGIAAGMLIAAIHLAGLVTLTHTPSPMRFLSRILKRPDYERPFLLLPVGYPADDCVVPDLNRKPLEEIMVVDR